MAKDVTKLVHLPGTRLGPKEVLYRTLNKVEDIESVAIMIRWKEDGALSADWSQMKMTVLASLSKLFDMEVTIVFDNAREE